nr:hypothetical protein CFP56_55490 [Quercus suber]
MLQIAAAHNGDASDRCYVQRRRFRSSLRSTATLQLTAAHNEKQVAKKQKGDEDVEQAVVKQKVEVKTQKKKKVETSSSSSSEDDSSSESEEEVKINKKKPPVEESSDDSLDVESSDDSDNEPASKKHASVAKNGTLGDDFGVVQLQVKTLFG